MSCRQKIGKALKITDFFNSRELLRFQKQNDYRTVTGGFISLVIIIVIIAGFARMISDTLNLSIITYTLKTEKQPNPKQSKMVTSPEANFMFGIQLGSWGYEYQRFNLSSEVRYFDIQIISMQLESARIMNYSLLDLQKCSQNHWKSIKNSVENFEKLKVDNWLCPKIGQNFSLGGKYTSSKASTIQISVSPCKNQSDPTRLCAPQDEIDRFFVDNGERFYFTIYYINTIINPDQPTYLTYYLEDMTFVIFGRKMGMQSYLYFSDYEIDTDFSIWPFENMKYENGFLVDQKPLQYPFYIFNNETKYLSFFFAKGANSYFYQRQVQKISSVFSFIGGLIGAIVAALFFINAFTSYSYEISLARIIFDNLKTEAKDTNNNELTEIKLQKVDNVQNPTIFQYIKFHFYNLRKILCKNVEWPAMQQISLYINQITHQLDVKFVIKRLIFLEFCIQHMLEDYQLSELHLNLPRTPEKIKQMREKIAGFEIEDKSSEKIANDEDDQNNQEPTFQNRSIDNYIRKKIASEQSSNGAIGLQYTKQIQKNSLQIENISCSSSQNQKSGIYLKTNKKMYEIQNFLRLQQSSRKGDRVSQRILQTSRSNQQAKKKLSSRKQSQFSQNRKQSISKSFQIPVQLTTPHQLIKISN